MIGKSADQKQRNLFNPLLTDFIDMGHELVLLPNKIEWKYFEEEFCGFYSITGQPAVPIHMMVGCLLLKQMYNLGDETLAQAWVRDPYMQYFCGEAHFQHRFPFDPSDFVHFRKRIGLDGVEKNLQAHSHPARRKGSIKNGVVLHNGSGEFVTYPTDANQYKRVIDDVNRISEEEGYRQRQRNTRISKQLLRDTYNGNHPRRKKKSKKAIRNLWTIGSRVVRELEEI
jgi:IS5 family transposase